MSLTISQTKKYVRESLPKELYKRLKPSFTSNTFRRKNGCYIGIYTPSWINVNVDEKFEITTNGITFTIRNSKVCISVWIVNNVPASICIY